MPLTKSKLLKVFLYNLYSFGKLQCYLKHIAVKEWFLVIVACILTASNDPNEVIKNLEIVDIQTHVSWWLAI